MIFRGSRRSAQPRGNEFSEADIFIIFISFVDNIGLAVWETGYGQCSMIDYYIPRVSNILKLTMLQCRRFWCLSVFLGHEHTSGRRIQRVRISFSNIESVKTEKQKYKQSIEVALIDTYISENFTKFQPRHNKVQVFLQLFGRKSVGGDWDSDSAI